jgi:hypothetical protein
MASREAAAAVMTGKPASASRRASSAGPEHFIEAVVQPTSSSRAPQAFSSTMACTMPSASSPQ